MEMLGMHMSRYLYDLSKKMCTLFAKFISCFQNLMYRFLRDLCPPRRGSPQVLITSRPPTPSHMQKVDVYNMSDITRVFRKMINEVSKNKKRFGTESRFLIFLEANRANRANQANREHAKLQFRMCR